MSYDLFPAVDSLYRFPPEVRAALAESVELRSLVIPMTNTQRNNLTGADLWDGRLVLNTTTDHINRYDGGSSSWKVIPNQEDLDALPQGVLGKAVYGSNQNGIIGVTPLTGLSVPVTMPAGRQVRVSAHVTATMVTVGGQTEVNILNDVGTMIARSGCNLLATGFGTYDPWCVIEPAAGARTYYLQATANGADHMETLSGTSPSYLMVEDLGAV